jgi:hypothetical protein
MTMQYRLLSAPEPDGGSMWVQTVADGERPKICPDGYVLQQRDPDTGTYFEITEADLPPA